MHVSSEPSTQLDPQTSSLFRSCRAALSNVAMFSCIINLLMLTGPLFMLQIYDRILASGSMATLMVLAALAAVLFIFLGLFEFIRSRVSARIASLVDEEIHTPLFAAIIENSGNGKQDIRSQPLRDLETMRQFISGPSPGTLFDLPWTPIYLAGC